jgi:hypothetical protein
MLPHESVPLATPTRRGRPHPEPARSRMTDPKPSPAPTTLGVSLLGDAARSWAKPLIETLSGSFVSLYLYGSALESSFRPERSDVNLLLMTRTLPASALRALAAAWPGDTIAGARVNLVLLATDQLTRALDAFALEVSDIRTRGKLLAGVDLLESQTVPVAALRMHIERELSLAVMRLRRSFLRDRDDPAAAARTLGNAAGAVAACGRGIAYLDRAPVPLGAEAAIAFAARYVGVEPRAWLEAWRLRGEKTPPASMETLYLDFLDATEVLLRRVDSMSVKER